MATVLPRPVPSRRRSGPYENIAASLREAIRSGRLAPGEQLPTMAELAVANSCAVGTAHRAVALIREEGLIDVARGRRAVVLPTPPRADL
ncbi:GntR family transcriptional regulator [Pseudonocardia sediminis]|uniref:GntR family transcriptional regulator n=1 Tax=Pseudonocardia sediminis TaxID=1397368 RepID=UPI003BF8B9D8